MLKKKIIIHLLSLGVLCSGFVLCRYVFFDIHGMKQWPAILFGIGIIAVVISFILDGKTTPICIAFSYIVGFVVGIETIIEKVYFNNSPNGWATAVILLCVFGGLQIFCLGIIGEYVGQVFREVKGRPRYIKEDELQ